MKKILLLFQIILLAVVFVACDDTYLDRFPKDELTEETTFTTNANFETFSWGFYNWFPGYDMSQQNADMDGDLMLYNPTSQYTDRSWLWGQVTVPSSSTDWTTPYQRIRRANLMLDNIDDSEMTDAQKKHWRSVAYFFRAFAYYDLLSKYGGVPWIEHVLTDGDTEILYGPRDSRDVVATNILENLQYAEENIYEDGNGDNTINKNVVRAMISRFGLFEGTWRKYHGLGDETKYLQASFDAGQALVAENLGLMDSYDLVFNSEDLAGQPGILLFKHYLTGQMTHVLTSRERNSTGWWDLTRAGVDLYLCTDGKPCSNSDLFGGYENIFDEFRNRDTRLYFTVVPPFKVKTLPAASNSTRDFEYTGVAEDQMYIDIVNGMTTEKQKLMPERNWNGFVVRQAPNFRWVGNPNYNSGKTGYKLFKYYNQLNTGIQNQDFADAPLFRMGEVLVNYAEAAYELNKFTQEIANQTINQLRARGGVADLDITNITEDLYRDADITPVLWEIRRERAVELMAEGFRFDDIRRWKKLQEYGNKEKLGSYVRQSDYKATFPIQNGASEGFISPFGVPPGIPDYYYLYPIPSEEIVLNPELDQNPGWESN